MRTELDSYASFPLCSLNAYSNYQLSNATEGLHYLHSCNVIHGDLKGVRSSILRIAVTLTLGQPNILVDSTGRVRLADFGLAAVTQNPNSVQLASLQHGYTPGWSAPEILKEEGGCSKKADVFSFAMVMIEVRRLRSTVERR